MQHFSNILVVVNEETPKINAAMMQGVKLSSGRDSELTLMCVIEPPGRSFISYKGIFKPEELLELRLNQIKEALLDLSNQFTGINVKVHVTTGTDFIEVIRHVVYEKHDLIIKMANTSDNGFDSRDFHLMRKSPVPVWLHRPEDSSVQVNENNDTAEASRPFKILAAVDLNQESEKVGRELNRRIIDLATSLGLSSESSPQAAELHLLSCWNLYGENSLRDSVFVKISEHQLTQLLDQERGFNHTIMSNLVAQFPFAEITCHLLKGNAADLIPAFAVEHEIDIIVMGTVARSGIPGLLIGNTAETVLHKIDCSVLTLKPSGFISIIK